MNFPDVDQSLLATLPPIVRAVVKALGFARAQEWLRHYGGVNVNILLKKCRALGLQDDELIRLRQVLAPHLDANQRISLPKADKLLAMARNAVIIGTADQDSIARQARLYNLSGRHITNIRRKGRDSGGQLDLFGE